MRALLLPLLALLAATPAAAQDLGARIARDLAAGGPACIGAMAAAHPARAAALQAAVILEVRTPSGLRLSAGSGTVVLGSDADGRGQRILTAEHVVSPFHIDPLLPAFDRLLAKAIATFPEMPSEAALRALIRRLPALAALGTPETAANRILRVLLRDGGHDDPAMRDALARATGADPRAADLRGLLVEAWTFDRVHLGAFALAAASSDRGILTRAHDDPNDVAVLAPRALTPAGQARLARMGAPLAPLQALRATHGIAGDAETPAPTEGFSGAGALDASGAITGVAVRVLRPQSTLLHPVAVPAAARRPGLPAAARPTAVPPFEAQVLASFAPVSDPGILAALGAAGREVRAVPDPGVRTRTLLLGIHQGQACAASVASHRPLPLLSRLVDASPIRPSEAALLALGAPDPRRPGP